MQPKLIINFRDLSEASFLAKGQLITTSLTGNVNFPLPWAVNTVPPATLAIQFAAYEAAYNAALGGDSAKIIIRQAAREVLTASFKKNAPYLEVVAGGSVPVLETTGYDLRHDSTGGGAPAVLDAPGGFTVKRGALSGTVTMGCAALPGAGSYQAQQCTGDPTVEANWSDAATFKHCAHNTLGGLVPGKTYSFRLRGIGANGPGPWCNFITLIVV
jgi:hypothetical protein